VYPYAARVKRLWLASRLRTLALSRSQVVTPGSLSIRERMSFVWQDTRGEWVSRPAADGAHRLETPLPWLPPCISAHGYRLHDVRSARLNRLLRYRLKAANASAAVFIHSQEAFRLVEIPLTTASADEAVV